jgi:hypothetical protein
MRLALDNRSCLYIISLHINKLNVLRIIVTNIKRTKDPWPKLKPSNLPVRNQRKH